MDTMAAKPPITFQVIDWFATDYENEDESDSGDDSDDGRRGNQEPPKSYLIKLFGMDEAGTTISLNVTGFTPYFYVKLPGPISNQGFDAVSKLLERFHHSLVDMRVVRRKDFWGFTNNTKFWFIRLSFKNRATMRSVEYVFSKPVYIPGCGRVALKVYESNVEPFLRFIHRRNISPSGWVTVTNYHNEPEHLPTHCKRNLTAAWTNVTGVERAATAPFVIASFDLECTSSHGDFPVPKKDYMRMAREMADLYRNSASLKGNPTALRKTLRAGILAAFSEEGEPTPTFSRMYPKKRVKMARLEDVLDMHMQELVEVLKGNIAYDEEQDGGGGAPEEPQSAFDIITENQRHLLDDDDAPEPLSHDKVVTQLNEILSAHFPAIQGDSIIQIGTVFQTCGVAPMRKVILTLGTCTPIPDIEVVPCATERELLLKWAELIVAADPDILIGYNIFGFDMWYLAERASELGCSLEFLQLGRIKGRDSPYVEQNLSSSALGDNVLKMIQMEGRVSIDLMKVVQRDHRLDTYKLDNVSAVFMKGAIVSYEGARLVVDRTEGISANGFIKLGNGAKVLVTRVDPDTRTVWLDAPLAPGSLAKPELTWGLAKDDITPQQIFQCQKGTADDRALIAKYCIQDCQLCNFLMIKLQILANNFGMSNVCSVPLSYIFQRGQGVKIFSLVSKQAAADGFVIPTIRKPRGEVEEEDDGYEGAIVLDPIPGIYIDEPISVLDYASLYPSSMISENISHDSIVLDPAYDNLPGMEYLDITYDLYEGDGDKKRKSGERVCRYAQFPDGEKGIIPRILQTLLVARKTTRKKMEEKTVRMRDGTVHTGLVKARTETELVLASGLSLPLADVESTVDSYDDFQKAVLDGLQLAYKVTANSVYGQVGAKTSAIHMKDLAASTTATGRNLILSAKAFLESECGAKVIYGDSVMPYTPITVLCADGGVRVVPIEGLATSWTDYPQFKAGEPGLVNKEQSDGDALDLQVWTHLGWAKIKRVIRHETTKRIYRVVTGSGLVDVTEDHSLLRPNGDQVKPGALGVGVKLLHSAPTLVGRRLCVTEADMGGDQVAAQARVLSLQAQGHDTYIGSGYAITTRRAPKSKDPTAVTGIQVLHSSYSGYVYDLETEAGVFHAGVGNLIVKNTDSVFAIFPNEELRVDPHTGAMERVKLHGKDALKTSIKLAQEGSERFRKLLKKPHDLEYEKTFFPFIILSKKRYVGNKYEMDDKKFKQNSMGIVLKRRDNANIVKHVYGGVLDIILNERDVKKSITFLNTCLTELIDGRVPLEQLVITKTLRGHYKNPRQIAHKVLADRMKERDPGSAPQSNDRIPYVYVRPPAPKNVPVKGGPPAKTLLQGERIETPTYILAEKLVPDYEFYMTNQIMKPVVQLYALILEQLKGYKRPADHWARVEAELVKQSGLTSKKIKERIARQREKDTEDILFGPYLKKLSNRKQNLREISSYFKPNPI